MDHEKAKQGVSRDVVSRVKCFVRKPRCEKACIKGRNPEGMHSPLMLSVKNPLQAVCVGGIFMESQLVLQICWL